MVSRVFFAVMLAVVTGAALAASAPNTDETVRVGEVCYDLGPQLVPPPPPTAQPSMQPTGRGLHRRLRAKPTEGPLWARFRPMQPTTKPLMQSTTGPTRAVLITLLLLGCVCMAEMAGSMLAMRMKVNMSTRVLLMGFAASFGMADHRSPPFTHMLSDDDVVNPLLTGLVVLCGALALCGVLALLLGNEVYPRCQASFEVHLVNTLLVGGCLFTAGLTGSMLLMLSPATRAFEDALGKRLLPLWNAVEYPLMAMWSLLIQLPELLGVALLALGGWWLLLNRCRALVRRIRPKIWQVAQQFKEHWRQPEGTSDRDGHGNVVPPSEVHEDSRQLTGTGDEDGHGNVVRPSEAHEHRRQLTGTGDPDGHGNAGPPSQVHRDSRQPTSLSRMAISPRRNSSTLGSQRGGARRRVVSALNWLGRRGTGDRDGHGNVVPPSQVQEYSRQSSGTGDRDGHPNRQEMMSFAALGWCIGAFGRFTIEESWVVSNGQCCSPEFYTSCLATIALKYFSGVLLGLNLTGHTKLLTTKKKLLLCYIFSSLTPTGALVRMYASILEAKGHGFDGFVIRSSFSVLSMAIAFYISGVAPNLKWFSRHMLLEGWQVVLLLYPGLHRLWEGVLGGY